MTTEKMDVSGVAIRAGLSLNRIFYSKEELQKFTKTLQNRPVLKDHDYRTDMTVGKIVKTKFVDSAVEFKGWVADDGNNLLEKIRDQRISEVSIGAVCGRICKENEDDDFYIVKDLKALELSLTPTPATVGTSMHQAIEQMENVEEPSDIENIKPVIENITLINEKFDIKESRKKVEIEEKVFCPYCEKPFMSLEQLRKHLKKHTEEIVGDEKKLTENLENKEAEANKMAEEDKLKEREDALKVKEAEATEKIKALEEKTKVLKEAEDKFAEVKRQESATAYKELCKEKKIEARETEKLSEEILKVLIEEVGKIQVKEDEPEKPAEPEEPAPAPEKPAEPAPEKPADEPKPENKTKGKIVTNVPTEGTVPESLKGIAVVKSDFGRGYSMYRENYDDPKLYKLNRNA